MILVTGATGIVGSHILAELLQRNNSVRVLTRETRSRQPILQILRHHNIRPDAIEYVKGDINDPVSLRDAVRGCEEVYHCAAMVSFQPNDRKALFQTNIQGTANVVNACLEQGIKKLCYISSTSAIGDEWIDGYLREESLWTTDKGRSAYSISKRYAELEVCRGREEGLNAVILNPAVVIGPGRWGESSTSLILSCVKGMRYYSSGENGFVDARDVARFATDAMEQGRFNDRYLLVGENLGFKDLFTLICQQLGKRPPSVAIPEALAGLAGKGLQWLESAGYSGSLTSENIKSAYRKNRYSAERSKKAGLVYFPISEAVAYTVEVYKKHYTKRV